MKAPEKNTDLPEDNFQNLMRDAPVGLLVLLGEEMRVKVVNEMYCRFANLKDEQLRDKLLFDVHPGAKDYFYPIIKKVYSSGEAFHLYDHPYFINRNAEKKDGFLNITYQPYKNEDGKIAGVMILCYDVTKEVKYRKQLEESETYFKNLTDTVPTIIWITNTEGYCTYLNKNWYDYTGQTRDEAEGFGWLNATHPDDKAYTEKLFLDSNKSHLPFHALYRLRNKHGQYRWVIDSAGPKFGEDGTYEGMVGTVVEVHEQKIAEEKIKDSEARFRSLIAAAPIAIGLFIGRDLIIEEPNQAFIEIVGKGDWIIGKPLREAMPELITEGQPFLKILDDVYTSGKMFQTFGTQVKIVQNGILTDNYYDFTYTPLFNNEGKVYAILDLAIDVTPQVKAKQQLEESEANLRNIILQAPVAMCIFKGPLHIVNTANDRMLEFWGKTANQVLNKPIFEGLSEASNQGFEAMLNDVYSTGKTVRNYEIPVTLPRNGELQIVYVDFVFEAFKDGDNKIAGIMAVAVEVTEKVLSHKKIEASNLFARSIIQNSEVAQIVWMGKDMIFDMVNEKMLEILARDISIIGKPLLEVIPSEGGNLLLERLREVLQTGKSFHRSEDAFTFTRGNETITAYYNYTYKPLSNVPGENYGVICTASDVTEQVVARQKIKEAEEKAMLAIESADLGTYEVNLLSDEIKTSERFRVIWGVNRHMERKDFAEFIHPDDRELRAKAHEEALVTGNLHYEARIISDNRPIHWIRVKGKVIFENRTAVTLLGVIQDITEQKLFAEELKIQVSQRTAELNRSNEDLLQFAHVTSHDLKEPVRKIKTFNNRLQDEFGALLPDKGRSYLNKVEHATDRMFAMIEGVLTYSTLNSSDEPIEMVNLNEIITHIETDLEVFIQKKEALVRVGELPVIEGANVLIHQLFYNLINNSLKFSREGIPPVITIEGSKILREDIAYALIIVKDNGIGFEEEFTEKIFNAFSRLHPKDLYEGTGLGLALCKRIVERHHGFISAEGSKNSGAGFTILLPLIQSQKKI